MGTAPRAPHGRNPHERHRPAEVQHREVEKLFAELEKAKDRAGSKSCSPRLADKLAGHAPIEEHQFYPAVKRGGPRTSCSSRWRSTSGSNASSPTY